MNRNPVEFRNEIVHGKRGITTDAAIRLVRYFGTSEEFWMNMTQPSRFVWSKSGHGVSMGSRGGAARYVLPSLR